MGRFRIGPFLAAACAAASTAGAAPPSLDWHWSNPSPTGNSLVGMAFQDSARGAAVSDKGEVAETRDGGKTWSLRSGRIEAGNLTAVDARRAENLLGCSANGRVWKSTDGGANWRVTGGLLGALYDIRACGSGIALAVGSRGTILRSADDGDSWTRVRRDSSGPELTGVHCGEGTDAFAVGRNGLLLRSRDGGAAWSALPAPSPDLLTRVAFADPLRGLITTGEGSVLTTRDGGATWSGTLLDSVIYLRSAAWSGRNAIVCGSDGALWTSRDEGATWTRAETGTPFSLQAAVYDSQGGAVAVGDGGTILDSRDWGASWRPRSIGRTDNMMGLAPISPGKWMAYGIDGLLAKTVDGGKTWEVKDTGSSFYVSGAFRGSRGVITTYDGTLIHSEDEGETWRSAVSPPPPDPGRLFGVDFADSATAVAVGDGGMVWRSVDYGRNWRAVGAIPDLRGLGLNAIAFHPDGSGIIVGDSGLILATSDRGASWSRVPSPVSSDLFGLAFRDSRAGMAVGTDGIVLWTADGGRTWEAGSTGNPDEILLYAAWLGGDTALVHGDAGHSAIVRMTPDRGRTWAEMPQPTRLILWTMKGLGDGRAAFLGERGAIVIGTLRPGSGPGPGSGQSLAAEFSMQRTGVGLRALLTLPRAARFRIRAHGLTGKSLGRVFGGELSAGRHSLVLPAGERIGPTIYVLESEDKGSPIRRSSLVPF